MSYMQLNQKYNQLKDEKLKANVVAQRKKQQMLCTLMAKKNQNHL